MKRDNKFSIITICYNEPQLKRTCESIVNQTFQDFEWIVIDGGSNQETLDIFEKYKSRIDYFVSEPDGGRYNAMNKGINVATGEYLNFMNAGDCFYDNEVLEKVVNNIKTNADVYYGNGYFNFSNHLEERKYQCKLDACLVYTKPLFHQSMFFKKVAFEKYGFYNEKYKIVADLEYYLRLLKNGLNFEYIDLFIAKNDVFGISIINRDLCEMERKKILKTFFTENEQKLIIEEEKRNHWTSIVKKIRENKI